MDKVTRRSFVTTVGAAWDVPNVFVIGAPDRGRDVHTCGEHGARTCEACHGAHGEGMAAAHVPRIAGQSDEYLQKT